MAFEKMGAFTFNHAEQPDELNVAADIAKANFDSRANELKTVLNKVVDLLNATTDGASGADNVGATAVDGLTGKTVQTILEELKTLVDTKETPTGAQTKANTAESSAKTYADGQVGDLAGEGRTTETVKGNADAHIAHLAESASKHITESGENENGRYIKFDDGTMICISKRQVTLSSNTQIGAFFRSTDITSEYPALFTSIPITSVSHAPENGNALLRWAIIYKLRISSVLLFLVGPEAFTDVLAEFNVIAVGRWK